MSIAYGKGPYGGGPYGGGIPPAPTPPVALVSIAAVGTTIGLTELALDPATDDVAIPPYFQKGPAALATKIRVRFRFFLGEWFLDQRLGVPYFQQVLIKNADTTVISSIFTRVLLGTPGIKSVPVMSATIDRPRRRLISSFVALLNEGGFIEATDEPFIIGN